LVEHPDANPQTKYQLSFKVHILEGRVGGVPINFYFSDTETVFWAKSGWA
jgi:hypothetical protein